MSGVSNECVVFFIGENINPNDEIFNFANFIRILNDLYERREKVALVNFIEQIDKENLNVQLPKVLQNDNKRNIEILFNLIFSKNKKLEEFQYDEEIIKLLGKTIDDSFYLNKLIENKTDALILLRQNASLSSYKSRQGTTIQRTVQRTVQKGSPSNSGIESSVGSNVPKKKVYQEKSYKV